MLIAILIGVAGLAVSAIAYANRDQLDDDHPLLRRVPYLAIAVASLAIAVGIEIVLSNGQTQHGVPGYNAGTGPSIP